MIAAIILFIFPTKPLASWAYSFVVWDGYVYIISKNIAEDPAKEIGEVTYYSDAEGTYSGNFSNTYEKGTKYFAITGVSTNVAIAVQERDGTFITAFRDHEYEGNRTVDVPIAGVAILFIVIVFSVFFLEKRARKSQQR